MKMVFPIHRCIVILSMIITQLQKCISIKVYGLKAVSYIASYILLLPVFVLTIGCRLERTAEDLGPPKHAIHSQGVPEI